MKKLFFLLLIIPAFIFSQTPPPTPRYNVGAMCDLGVNAAATILVPYFEVDSSNPLGLDTLIAITNIGDNNTIAHVTVFNVDSHPVFDFNIFLTPYDIVTFSMRDIIVNGNFPNNGCTSTHWYFTHGWIDCNNDGTYFGQATCNPSMFTYFGWNMDLACYDPATADFLARVQCWLTEGSVYFPSTNYKGYITIDNSVTCSGAYPSYNGYLAPACIDTDRNNINDHPVAENSNVFIADVIYYDYANVQADAVPAVHVEAVGEAYSTLPDHQWGVQPGDIAAAAVFTFYDKYVSALGLPHADLREPLPIWWAVRYINNPAFNGGTWIDVWRSDSQALPNLVAGTCREGSALRWSQKQYDVPFIVCYNEEEETLAGPGGGTPSPPPEAPAGFNELRAETQRTRIRHPEFPIPPDESGWCGIAFDVSGSMDQAWVNVRSIALNRYTISYTAGSYDGACALVWDPVISGFTISTPIY